MVIGNRIKELRSRKGLSQQELGQKIGVTKVSICGYEIGSRSPTIETLSAIADALDTNTDYLLGREIAIANEETKKYLGSVSLEDILLIQELRHYPNLYNKILKDIKRSVSIINKRLTKD